MQYRLCFLVQDDRKRETLQPEVKDGVMPVRCLHSEVD